jgi:hypothetical protein
MSWALWKRCSGAAVAAFDLTPVPGSPKLMSRSVRKEMP